MNDLRIQGIQRNPALTLTVNGQPLTAYAGETLLAALIAAGIKSQKTSPVTHERRGGLCGMGVCYECLVTVNGQPRVRACMTEVEQGMVVVTE